MRYHLALSLVDAGIPISRAAWGDKNIVVFKNEHRDLVRQQPGMPQFPFDPTDADIEASDWEVGR